MLKILKNYCNGGGNITEEGSSGAILQFLHKKPLSWKSITANCLHKVVHEYWQQNQYKEQIPDYA